MKTVYGKLAALVALLIAALLLFAPMRSGLEDYLYARPRLIRMNRGDAYGISYRLYADGEQPVSFTSANESVATVSDSGVITAVGPGRTQIRLLARDGAKAQVQVEVAGAPATTLTLNTAALRMEKGQVTGLRAIFNCEAEDTAVAWVSLDENVARVDAVGRVTAVGGGTTRVFATARSGISASAEVSVHVSGTAMRITPEDLIVGEGALLHLDAYYLPDDTTDEVDHWLTSDTNILRIQDDGTIYAVGEGQAVVSVFSKEGLSTSSVIQVEKAVADFEVSPAAATLERGNSLLVEPRFYDAQGQLDADSSSHYVIWSSSNPAVATVENGVVKAVRSGEARITATADGKAAVCNLQVQTLVREVRLNMDEIYLLREQTVEPIQLRAEVLPVDADDKLLTYTTDNDLVATVSPEGLVTPVGGYGTATITARATSGAEAKFTVNVVAELPEEE